MPDGRRRDSPSRHDEHKLFVGGISHKFRDTDLKKAFSQFGSVRATVMIDRKTGRSRGFGFVYLGEHEAIHDAIKEMHGAFLDGRKISVTRAVPETQTIPGTPAPLLAAGKGIRSSRGSRASGWEGSEAARGSPRAGSRGRTKRFERGGRYPKSTNGFSGRSRGRSPFERSLHNSSRERSRSASPEADSRGSTPESQGSPRGANEPLSLTFPPYESAAKLLAVLDWDDSGFNEYATKCVPLDMARWSPMNDESPVRRRKEHRGSQDRTERAPSWQHHSGGQETVAGVGGMRGAPRSRPEREPSSSVRGRPERYSRDLR